MSTTPPRRHSRILAGAGEVRTIPSPRLWTHLRLSAEMARHRPDLLFVPSHVIPLLHPRSVVTVHDLGYLHELGAHPAAQRHMLDLTTRWNARARQIIAISATTRQDLIERYRTPPDRIAVIHHGVGAQFKPASSDEISAVRTNTRSPINLYLRSAQSSPAKILHALLRQSPVSMALPWSRPVAGDGWPTTSLREFGPPSPNRAAGSKPAMYQPRMRRH